MSMSFRIQSPAMQGTISALMLGAAIVAASAAGAQTTLEVASAFPKNMIFLGESVENLGKLIEIATNGEVKLNVHNVGDLVPMMEILNAVSTGAVPTGWDTALY